MTEALIVPGVPPLAGVTVNHDALEVAVQFTFVVLGLVMETACAAEDVVVPTCCVKASEVGLATSEAFVGITVSVTVTV